MNFIILIDWVAKLFYSWIGILIDERVNILYKVENEADNFNLWTELYVISILFLDAAYMRGTIVCLVMYFILNGCNSALRLDVIWLPALKRALMSYNRDDSVVSLHFLGKIIHFSQILGTCIIFIILQANFALRWFTTGMRLMLEVSPCQSHRVRELNLNLGIFRNFAMKSRRPEVGQAPLGPLNIFFSKIIIDLDTSWLILS